MPEVLLMRFGEHYARLYACRDAVEGFAAAMERAEGFIEDRPMQFGQLVYLRGDLFTSDREMAALGFALEECGWEAAA